MLPSSAVVLYGLPLATAWTYYVLHRYRSHRKTLNMKRHAREAGLDEPISFHPVIDPLKCIGCKACIYACPERQIFGASGHKVEVLAAGNCVGHGACKMACPTAAIELVFGSEKRGVSLPIVGKDFQSTVPGIYIAGELGGMGLIRNAIEQGRQAMEAIAATLSYDPQQAGVLDAVIVGAGPAGIAASLSAKQHGLRFVTLEQDSIGGTVAHYPRRKIVMTAPARLPGVGDMRFRKVGKETLMTYWGEVLRKVPLPIRTGERVDRIDRAPHGLTVTTAAGVYATRNVLLAIGRRGSPQTLGVPGEDMPKVCYRLKEPAQYRGAKVLVVGGGDSAVEAAVILAGESGTQVTLAYRGERLVRPRQENRKALDRLTRQGRVELMLNTTVSRIEAGRVLLMQGDTFTERNNDAVIICTGGVAPVAFLRSIGIATEMKHGTA